MSNNMANMDLLRKAYERLVDANIYCLGIAELLDENGHELGNEFSDIMSKHCDIITSVEELIKSEGDQE